MPLLMSKIFFPTFPHHSSALSRTIVLLCRSHLQHPRKFSGSAPILQRRNEHHKNSTQTWRTIRPLSNIWLRNLIRGQNSHILAQVPLYTFLFFSSFYFLAPNHPITITTTHHPLLTMNWHTKLPYRVAVFSLWITQRLKEATLTQELKMLFKVLNAHFT